MNSETFSKIKAVAFDIDGTLYEEWKLNSRCIFYFIRYNQFFLKYGIVRAKLRKKNVRSHFIDVQNRTMGEMLGCSKEEAKERLDKIVYSGLSPYFEKITPCKNVKDFILFLKEKGFKIGLLSDFPPEQKGKIWGIAELCDTVLGTEKIGALKPFSEPFDYLANELDVKPEEILYVGNSFKNDVIGAKNAGCSTAWFVNKTKLFFAKLSGKSKIPDFIFTSYKDLQNKIQSYIEKKA